MACVRQIAIIVAAVLLLLCPSCANECRGVVVVGKISGTWDYGEPDEEEWEISADGVKIASGVGLQEKTFCIEAGKAYTVDGRDTYDWEDGTYGDGWEGTLSIKGKTNCKTYLNSYRSNFCISY